MTVSERHRLVEGLLGISGRAYETRGAGRPLELTVLVGPDIDRGMTDIVNIQAAKTHLSRLIERVEAGEEITLARAGRPVAKLVPYTVRRDPRRLALWEGRVKIAPDFDEINEAIADLFER
jgi:prevent-host-death family protein